MIRLARLMALLKRKLTREEYEDFQRWVSQFAGLSHDSEFDQIGMILVYLSGCFDLDRDLDITTEGD